MVAFMLIRQSGGQVADVLCTPTLGEAIASSVILVVDDAPRRSDGTLSHAEAFLMPHVDNPRSVVKIIAPPSDGPALRPHRGRVKDWEQRRPSRRGKRR